MARGLVNSGALKWESLPTLCGTIPWVWVLCYIKRRMLAEVQDSISTSRLWVQLAPVPKAAAVRTFCSWRTIPSNCFKHFLPRVDLAREFYQSNKKSREELFNLELHKVVKIIFYIIFGIKKTYRQKVNKNPKHFLQQNLKHNY